MIKENYVVLRPDEVWNPDKNRPEASSDNSDKPPCKFHVWKKLTLFRFDIWECIHCGQTREVDRDE